jgi:hypothetical protein
VGKHQTDDSETIGVDQLGEQDVDREDGDDGVAVGGREDIHETRLNQEEELDYGLGDNDEPEDDSGCESSWSWVDDDEDIESDYDNYMLGAEDGEGADGDTGDLGFGDL